jgi:hypothetical protein
MRRLNEAVKGRVTPVTEGLMQGMRRNVRVVMLPVAVVFLSLGAQITCVSADDLDATTGALLVVSAPHDAAMTGAGLALPTFDDCPYCSGDGSDPSDHVDSELCVVPVADDALTMATRAPHPTDDPLPIAPSPVHDLDATFDRRPVDHDQQAVTSVRSPGDAPYLRFCTFRE